MQATIWKYEIPIEDEFVIEMPDRAEIIHVETQDGKPQMWAIVPVFDVAMVRRHFRLVGTGHSLQTNGKKHVGSFMLAGGNFVGHVFEVATI